MSSKSEVARSKSEVQAVIFFRKDDNDKKKWDVAGAKKWLKDNNFKPIKKPDITLFTNQIRFRITPLEDENGIPIYSRFTTKILKHADGKDTDVNIILGWRNDNKKKNLKKKLKDKKKINLKPKKIKFNKGMKFPKKKKLII